jgi:hypothetical protein
MNSPSLYSLKVWLTSVFLSPFICSVIEYLLNFNRPAEFLTPFQIFPVIIIVEFIFSLITWLAFFGTIALTLHFIPNATHRKLISLLVGVIFTILTYLVCFFDEIVLRTDSFIFEMMVSNCLCIAAGSLFFKLGDITNKQLT